MKRVRKSDGSEWHVAEDYKDRDSHLCAMGFESYGQYLKSDLWKSIRHRVMDFFDGKCFCNSLADAIHHTDYSREVLEGKSVDADGTGVSGMVAICHACHDYIEFYWCDTTFRTVKASMEEAHRRYELLESLLETGTCGNCGKQCRAHCRDDGECGGCAYKRQPPKQRKPYFDLDDPDERQQYYEYYCDE